MYSEKQNKISLDKLREQALRLCGDNLFLAHEVKTYWLECIPREPRAVIEYLVELFSNFEKGWRAGVHERLMNDKDGKIKKAFEEFKKFQTRRFSKTSHEAEEAQAEANLEKSLNNLSDN